MEGYNMAVAKKSANFVLGILIGLLFICMGIEGIADLGTNELYRAIDSDIWNILMGVIILLAGLMLLVQTLGFGKLPKAYTLIAQIVIVVIWILVIVFADFVYGVKHTSGAEWIVWLENLIYHIMILACVGIVCFPTLAKAASKAKK